MRLASISLALVLVAGFVSACRGDDGDAGGDATSFEGTPWVLASGVDVEGWEEVPPSATFEDGTVTGSTGCNRFTAPYTLDGDSLGLAAVVSTRMACPPPKDAVESAYLAAFEQVAAWRIEGDELVLLDADDGELLRYATATLVGDWTATGFRQGDAVSSPLVDTEVRASFGEDGTLSGSSGCNSYRATYTTDGGEIEISQPAGTLMACAEPAGVMEQEAAYLAALPTATEYRLDGRSLELRTDDTIVATYTRAEP